MHCWISCASILSHPQHFFYFYYNKSLPRTLLKYNWQTIHCTYLKWTVWQVLAYVYTCEITTITQMRNIFITSKSFLMLLHILSFSPLYPAPLAVPRKSLIRFLCVSLHFPAACSSAWHRKPSWEVRVTWTPWDEQLWTPNKASQVWGLGVRWKSVISRQAVNPLPGVIHSVTMKGACMLSWALH